MIMAWFPLEEPEEEAKKAATENPDSGVVHFLLLAEAVEAVSRIEWQFQIM